MRPLQIEKFPLNGTVCIEASAGTGKTYTIGLIVIRLVMERGLDMGTLAVVTFTEAATAELAERIADFLRAAQNYLKDGIRSEEKKFRGVYDLVDSAKISHPHDDVQRHLNDALLNIDLARIVTIHGFCTRILDEFAFETGSSYGMEVITDQEYLIDQILADYWRREVAELPSALFALVQDITPASLKAKLQRLLQFPGIAVRGPAVTKEQFQLVTKKLQSQYTDHKKDVLALIKGASGNLNGKTYSNTRLEKILPEFENLITGSAKPDLKIIELLSPEKIKSARLAKSVTEFTSPLFVTIQEYLDFANSFADSIHASAYHYLTQELKRRKRTLRLRSYDDMITDLADGLEKGKERTASVIRKKFSAVLVDEFQDTDALQYRIFRSLFFNRDDVFFALIGDPKQAIYRFRGGDIKTYVNARNEIPELNRYTISVNYRSEQRLVSALNGIYELNKEICDKKGPFLTTDIGYFQVTSEQELQPPTQGTNTLPPVVLWHTPDGVRPDEKYIGKRIAHSIIGFMDQKSPLMLGPEKKRRALQFKDIAILVNSHSTAKVFKRILAQYGIRSVIAKSGSVLQSDESDEILTVLQSILNPGREKILRALLASKLYGYDLAALETWEHDEPRRNAMLENLNNAKDQWMNDGVATALNRFLTATGVFHLSDEPERELLQERSITNYRHIIELLHAEELRIGKYPERLLSSFIHMRSTNDAGSGEGTEQRLESDLDAVSIVTMHKAKGLQWPVVYAPDLIKDGLFSNSSSIDVYYDGNERVANIASQEKNIVKPLVENEISQERMRVAYVTLTRAESLVFVVTAKDWKKKKGSEIDLSPAALLLRSPDLSLLADDKGALVLSEPLDINGEFKRYNSQKLNDSDRSLPVWNKDRDLAEPWSIQSYSGLTKGSTFPVKAMVADEQPAAGVFAFPRGAEAGTALHSILERIDFIDAGKAGDTIPDGVRSLIEGVLTDSGLSPQKEPERLQQAWSMVKNVLHCPIPQISPDFCFGELRREDRVSEMEFFLSAGHTQTGKKKIQESHLRKILGDDCGRIGKGKSIHGYLNGFIDVVFKYRDKWYIVDWKSNHLGNSADRYDAAALEHAMKEHNYHLQYHLYSVALYRYLAVASGGKLNYKDNFGGVIYLFLRGVDGKGNGIYFARPEHETIKKLEELL